MPEHPSDDSLIPDNPEDDETDSSETQTEADDLTPSEDMLSDEVLEDTEADIIPQPASESEDLDNRVSAESENATSETADDAENVIFVASEDIENMASEAVDETRSDDASELELTAADLVGAFWRAPRATTQTFRSVMRSDGDIVDLPEPQFEEEHTRSFGERVRQWVDNRPRLQLILYLLATIEAIRGCFLLSNVALSRRSEAVELAAGAPVLLGAFFIWMSAELYGHWPELTEWWRGRTRANRVAIALRAIPVLLMTLGVAQLVDAMDASVLEVATVAVPGVIFLFLGIFLWVLLDIGTAIRRGIQPEPIERSDIDAEIEDRVELARRGNWFLDIPLSRFIFVFLGVVLSAIVWIGTAGNNLSTPIFYIWMASILFWSWAFAPFDWNPLQWIRHQLGRLGNFRIGSDWWVVLALTVIMALAVSFRFNDLATHPLEMTDDHVEKILDAGLIRDGLRPVFLANNGGREPFQMYAIALFSYLPGLGIDHYTIKFVAVVESLLTIPLLFWMGYALTPTEKRRDRLLVGLLLAGLVAVSYWHVAITRLGLRIVLTPLIVGLLTIFLARVLRHNRRADYILCGLILGFGLYMYQAVRMLPVVVVVAVLVAIYFNAKSWRQRITYGGNLAVLVLISVMVFLPMARYSVENPDLFWRRATGRLMGDDVVEVLQEDGTILTRNATIEERIQAFSDNVPALLSNIRNVLLMFNWKGDGATISGVPNEPAMDNLAGAFLIVSLAAWLVLAIRRRDPVYWLVPLFLFIMLLPSALSIAMPNENPSHTRASGALPYVYLMAAYPMVLITDRILMWLSGRAGKIIAVGFCTFVILGSYSANTFVYFSVYPRVYTESFHPYTEVGGFLRGFAESTGTYGNAYMIGYPFWWSHRAIGLAAGLQEKWPNGIVDRENIPRWLRDGSLRNDRYRFDPERDIVFFYAPQDEDSAELLVELFPEGWAREYETNKTGDNYMVYYVPALGEEAFRDFLSENLLPGQ